MWQDPVTGEESSVRGPVGSDVASAVSRSADAEWPSGGCPGRRGYPDFVTMAIPYAAECLLSHEPRSGVTFPRSLGLVGYRGQAAEAAGVWACS